MEKSRTLKRYGFGKSRQKDEPYKVALPLDNEISDELLLRLYDEHDKADPVATIIFHRDEIAGKKSLYFNARTDTNNTWDIEFRGNVKFKRIIVPQNS